MVIAAMKLKDACSLEGKYDGGNLVNILMEGMKDKLRKPLRK